MRWKERARWIKFEEDVEEETDRWGKPHVASLSFRSLLELRRTITHGNITCIFPTPISSSTTNLSMTVLGWNKIYLYEHDIKDKTRFCWNTENTFDSNRHFLFDRIWPDTHCRTPLFLLFLDRCTVGAILLDLEQNTLPGIAHLVVETMIISDQIRAEDRPNVLRALLLKHRSGF